MSTQHPSAAQLPRTSSLARLAIVAALSTPQRSRASIVAARWPELGDSQRELLTKHLPPRAANEISSVDFPASTTASGQLYTGISQQTLLGRLPVLADVKLRSVFGAFPSTEPTGVIRTPGQPIPLMALSFSQPDLQPITAAALTVISAELAEDSAAETGIRDLLLRATAKAADTEFLTRALDGASATASGADSAFQLRSQVRAMVAALVAAGANLTMTVLACNPSTIVLLATCSDGFGNSAFPTVSLAGPSTLCGLPLLPSFGVADGQIVAIAGDATLRAAGTVDVQASNSARLEFASDPTGAAEPGETPVGQTKQPVSLWQSDCRAVRVFYTFGADFVRNTRAAFIEGITLTGSTS